MRNLAFAVLTGLALLGSGYNAEAGKYKVEGKAGGDVFKAPIADVSVDSKDNICAIQQNGTLVILDAKTGQPAEIKTGMLNPSAVSYDGEGNIYVLATSTKLEDFTYQGRKVKRAVPTGVACSVFAPDGRKLRTFDLNGVKSAKTAKLAGGKLLVADMENSKIMVCDPASGNVTARIGNNLRLCCGIFNFTVGLDKNSIVVSNLGAFQVERYNLSGGKLGDFGQRGRQLNEFHGCCNPVSASALPDGSYITAEKDPTRIKIYDKTGKSAELIDGIEELVKGCSSIPIAVDSKGNIYLAANKSGPRPVAGPVSSNYYIVKCVKAQ